MKTLFKVALANGVETYVVSEDLTGAAQIAEDAYSQSSRGFSKVSHISVIATESSAAFNTRLLIVPEQFPENTYDGDTRAEGVYR